MGGYGTVRIRTAGSCRLCFEFNSARSRTGPTGVRAACRPIFLVRRAIRLVRQDRGKRSQETNQGRCAVTDGCAPRITVYTNGHRSPPCGSKGLFFTRLGMSRLRRVMSKADCVSSLPRVLVNPSWKTDKCQRLRIRDGRLRSYTNLSLAICSPACLSMDG